MRGRFHEEAPAQAAAMLATIELLHPGALDRLRDDPMAELATWSDVRLVEVVETSDRRCSVAGGYLDETEPPTLVVARSASYRRRGFTALHELGHHVQKTNLGLGQNLYTRQDSEAFEEFACDAFAARVLLPDEQVANLIEPRGPTAPGVAEMFRASRASREACCVRAAEHLTGAGAAVLLDVTGTVIFAAPRGMIPPARGSDQANTPLIAAVLRASATVERDNTFVSYRDGGRSGLLYGQAVRCDNDYLIAVLAIDNAAWRPLALPRPETGQSRMGYWWTCETCEDTTFQVWDPPCQRCRQPRCPDGHCGCDATRAAKERPCDRCHLVLAPSRFDGSSAICRDCS
jgi:Zn-dependent peptidase ImmA (M78 family)